MTLNYKNFFKEGDNYDSPREYWDSGHGAAGCIFISKDTGRILLAHRSSKTEEPNTWGTWGGKIDENESPRDAVEREVEEETGFNGQYKINPLYTFRDGSFKYHNYLVIVPFEFKPKLNWENDTSSWVEWGEWPEPLHFGLVELIKHAGNKIKRVVDLIKKKKAEVLETMDIPPSITQHAELPKTNGIMNMRAITNAYIIAATVWGEARGEGDEGMQAVLNVIMNRAKGDFSKAKDIVLKPKQFSMWNGIDNPDEYSMILASKMKTDKIYQKIIKLVDKAEKGQLPDITGGATFYFNPKKVNPSWAKKMIHTVTIGNHAFYKLSTHAKK